MLETAHTLPRYSTLRSTRMPITHLQTARCQLRLHHQVPPPRPAQPLRQPRAERPHHRPLTQPPAPQAPLGLLRQPLLLLQRLAGPVRHFSAEKALILIMSWFQAPSGAPTAVLEIHMVRLMYSMLWSRRVLAKELERLPVKSLTASRAGWRTVAQELQTLQLSLTA